MNKLYFVVIRRHYFKEITTPAENSEFMDVVV